MAVFGVPVAHDDAKSAFDRHERKGYLVSARNAQSRLAEFQDVASR
jgi:hypothetical protein